MKYPSSIGACIDALFKLQQDRLELQRKAQDLGGKERELEEHILNTFSKDQLKGASGKAGKVSVKTEEFPVIEDFDRLIAYVSRTKSWELMRRQLSVRAVKERWEAGKVVPGVGVAGKVSLHISRVKRTSKEK